MSGNKTALKISLIAITSAIVAVFTIAIRIPTPTGGYISLCDVAVFFTSYAFGPVVGLVAAGLGTAFADLIGGYPQWAVISFLVHGIEGLITGLIVRSVNDKLWRKIFAGVVGALIVPVGYFVLTGLFMTNFSEAIAEFIPNLIQASVGAVIGYSLYYAVSRAYRDLDSLRVGFSKKN